MTNNLYTLDTKELLEHFENNKPLNLIISGEVALAFLTQIKITGCMRHEPTNFKLREKWPQRSWSDFSLGFTACVAPSPFNHSGTENK